MIEEIDEAVSIGHVVRFRLTVTNPNENDPIHNFVVVDELPAHLELVEGSTKVVPDTNAHIITGAANEIRVVFTTLIADAVVHIYFDAKVVGSDSAGRVVNIARIHDFEPDPEGLLGAGETGREVNRDNEIVKVEEDPDNPSVSIAKTAPATGVAGELITYNLTVRNTGCVLLTSLVVRDALPSELENPKDVVLPDEATGGFNAAGAKLQVILGRLAPRESTVIKFSANIREDIESGTVISNTATVDYPDNWDVGDEDGSETEVVAGIPSVSITKVVQSTGVAGESITFEITVRNTGNVLLSGLEVRDTLPSKLINPTNVVLPDGATGGFSAAETALQVILGRLVSRESVTIRYTVDICEDSTTGTVIENTATVENPDNPDVRDEVVTKIEVVAENPSLSITRFMPDEREDVESDIEDENTSSVENLDSKDVGDEAEADSESEILPDQTEATDQPE